MRSLKFVHTKMKQVTGWADVRWVPVWLFYSVYLFFWACGMVITTIMYLGDWLRGKAT